MKINPYQIPDTENKNTVTEKNSFSIPLGIPVFIAIGWIAFWFQGIEKYIFVSVCLFLLFGMSRFKSPWCWPLGLVTTSIMEWVVFWIVIMIMLGLLEPASVSSRPPRAVKQSKQLPVLYVSPVITLFHK